MPTQYGMLGRDAEAEKKLMEQRQAAKLLQEAEAGFAQSPTVTPPVSSVASSSRAVDRPRGSKESSAGSGLLTPEEARRVREQVIRQRKQSHSPVDARRKKRESCDLPQDMTSRATGQDISRLTRAPSDSQRDSLPQDMTPAPTSAALRQAHADRDRLHRDSRKKIEDLSCVLVSCQKTIQQQQHTSEADRKTIENLREEVLMLSRRVHEVELERDRAQADFKASLNLIEDLTTSLTEQADEKIGYRRSDSGVQAARLQKIETESTEPLQLQASKDEVSRLRAATLPQEIDQGPAKMEATATDGPNEAASPSQEPNVAHLVSQIKKLEEVAEHWKKAEQETKLQLEQAKHHGEIQLYQAESREKELAYRLEKIDKELKDVRSAAEVQLQAQLEQGELVRRELAEMERELSDLLPRMNHELKQVQEDLQAAVEVAEHWKKAEQETKLQLEQAKHHGEIQLYQAESREKELAYRLEKIDKELKDVRSAAEVQLQAQLEQGELVRRELAEMERELSDLLPRMNHELKQVQEDLQAAVEVRTRDDVTKDEDDALLQKLFATERDRDLLKEQLDALIQRSVSIIQELEETRSNIKATEVEKQMHENKVETLEAQVTGLQEDRISLAQTIESLESKVATFEAQVAGLQQDRTSLVQTIESLDQDAQNTNQELKVAKARECELLAQIHESGKKVQDLRAAVEVRTRDDVKPSQRGLHIEDDRLLQKLFATERDRDLLKEQLDALIQELETTRSNMRVTEAVKDTVMAQLLQTNATLETLSVEFASLEAEKNEALSSLAEANEALEELAHHLPGGIN